jgi:small GTP-binding protein
MSEKTLDWSSMAKEAFEMVKKDLSDANVIIAGKTGVGKSTLINAMFHGDIAKVGAGKPVTQKIEKYEKLGIPIKLYDTKGLELKEYKDTISQVEDFVEECRQSENPNEHIHLAWVCITESSSRIEEGEQELINILNKSHIPVIVVITKANSKESAFKQEVEKLTESKAKKVIAIRAEAIFIETEEGEMKLPQFGLKELVNESLRLIPESQRYAFIAAQKVSIEKKKDQVNNIIHMSATAVAGASASPIPFSDAALIIPIQIAMIIKITHTYGIPLQEGAISSLAASVVGCTAATTVGRSFVGNLLKLAPGIGSAVGGVINGATAFALTEALGHLYSQVVSRLLVEKEGDVSSDDIIDELKKAWKNK